ncbi:MAG: META domain-containing protein [Candidatus Eisenbacteria bacterium]
MSARVAGPVLALSVVLCATGCAHHPVPASGTASSDVAGSAHPLIGVPWTWVRTVTQVEVIAPSDPTDYTFELGTDGRVSVRADCNRGSGAYTLDGPALHFGPMAMTLMACPPGSLDGQFLKQLGGAAHTFWQGDTLMIDLVADSGTMRFVSAR